MKRAEKVRLIEECLELLMERKWPLVLLVLKQFDFELPERDRWEDDDESYTLGVLQNGKDDDIRELHQFLRGEDAEPVHRVDDSPWGDHPVRVFLSHIHEERHLVGEVKKLLASHYSIDAFVAHDDIHVSKRWREVIKAGLATCDVFVAFLHDGYHASQWCDQEAGWALGRGVPIVVVRSAGSERRDGFLEEHQDFSIPKGTGSSAWPIARSIFLTAVNDARTREAGKLALVETFVNSWSYDTTRYLWALMQNVDKFEPAQLRRLEYAVQTNSQVYDAVVDGTLVPDLVATLIEKFEPRPPEDPWAAAQDGDEPPF